MRPILPWSYSALTGYENCPFRYYRERILEDAPKKEFEEASEGVRKHTAIELYLKGEAPLSDIPLRKTVDGTLSPHLNSTRLYEHKLAITKDRQPCEWDDPEAYHRGILDVLCIYPNEPTAFIFDWKSGKVNEYSDQLKANAITVMAHYPFVQTVSTEYVWFRFGKTTVGKVFRDMSDKIWEKFILRADRIEQSLIANDWPKRPSGLCKKYCPIVSCEFNGGTNVS